MSNAYRCNGCHEYFDLTDFEGPPFVIHRNGPIQFGDSPVLFAHSWDCVGRIAFQNTNHPDGLKAKQAARGKGEA